MKKDDVGPSFVPISLQINADPFISGVTTLSLTITPQSVPEARATDDPPTMSFSLSFYTLGGIVPPNEEKATASAILVELDPLPDVPTHYFANVPTSIPLYGDHANYDLETLEAIMELAGQTLVITATSDDPMMLSTTASVTIPIAS